MIGDDILQLCRVLYGLDLVISPLLSVQIPEITLSYY